MRYISTRGEAPALGFVDVTLAGLARDGGLYVPESWPRIDRDTIAGFAGKPYAEVAVEVLRAFAGGAVAESDLARMAREAYATFRHPAVTPLTQIGPNTFILELFHGPTLAFKDLAMQFLARMMDHALASRGERTTIAVATSGDTGGAAVEAFRGRAQVDLVVLFPNGRVSDVQRRMMTCVDAANVHTLAIDGTFDDCQAIVKAMFNHHALRDRVGLSGVNSINFARIAAQVVYYFVAAVALGAPHRKVAFTVPTGNFGDVFAGYVAAQMGLPVDRLTVATNVNDILARTLATGAYEVREVVATASPSMDIQVSSNFERLLFEAGGRDPRPVRAAMASLAQARSRCSIRAAGACGDPRDVHGRPCERSRDRRGDPHDLARNRHHARSAYRRRDRGRREGEPRSGRADGRAVDRACRQVSRRRRGGQRGASAAARLARRPGAPARARHRAARGSGRGRTFCRRRSAAQDAKERPA